MAAEDLNPLYLALLLNALAEDDPDLTYRLDTFAGTAPAVRNTGIH